MVIDTSAVAAILFGEPEQDELIGKIAAAPNRVISAGTLIEASIIVEVRFGEAGGRELDLFLHRAHVDTVATDQEQVVLARAAWRRYGRGRHPAGLNFGDLFAYALARSRGEPLLFKGDDFSKTDVLIA
jgi:ribonuclease VapC